MPLSDQPLWSRLAGMSIGPDEAALPFVDRLARDNAWSRAFALRVIEEYRRFLYLCCVGEQPATPSDEVDQAWHLHLTYTRSYWHELCGDVLGRPLHHGPTSGGPDERRRYDAQYRATLDAYQREFGETPPVDIWPDPATRFGRAYVRVDRNAVWLIDKEWLGSGLRHISAAALCLTLGACSQLVEDLWPIGAFEKAVLTIAVAIIVLVIVWRSVVVSSRRKRRNGAGGCGSGAGDDSGGCGSGCD